MEGEIRYTTDMGETLDQVGINDLKVVEFEGETVIYLATTEGVWSYRVLNDV